MAEYATRYNRDAGAYYVAEISGDEGDDIATTKLFPTLRDAERYKDACQEGKETFQAGYAPPTPPVKAIGAAPQLPTPATPTPKVERSSSGLRNALFDELDAIRNGSSTPSRAKAVATLAAQIVDVVKLEIEVAKHAADQKTSVEETMPKIPL